MCRFYRQIRQKVSIHAPVRGATWQRKSDIRSSCSFNSRPRAGGNLTSHPSILLFGLFQFTPPCGGQLNKLVGGDSGGSFNSRPRAGGNGSVDEYHAHETVSIHAPVRGATAIIHRNILLFLYIMPKTKTQ